jgi:Arc/MetJ-type ribon-helix-helix transcriptional regulator
MSVRSGKQGSSLRLPERTLVQLDELVRRGRFKNHQAAVAAAVERLYAEEHHHLTARQEAFTRLCGALQLGTSPESLRIAELDRLDWESGQR